MCDSTIKTILKNSNSVDSFQKELESQICTLRKVVLPQTHVKDLERMVNNLSGCESFFHATQESLVLIQGENPCSGVKSASSDFLRALREDRDNFCQKVSDIKDTLRADKVQKKKLKVFEDALEKAKETANSLELLLNCEEKSLISLLHLKWIGFRLFKATFLGKLKVMS